MEGTSKSDSAESAVERNWSAEKLWDLRFCVRHRLPLHKAAKFLGRSETEVREKAAELGLKLFEEN